MSEVSTSRTLQPTTCFACGTENPHGLHLAFQNVDGGAQATFVPTGYHEGWPGIVHGGVLATVMDEAMAYALWYAGIHAVTARMDSRFRRPVSAGDALEVTAEVVAQRGAVVDAKVRISLRAGETVAEGTGRFMRADVDYA